MPNKSVENRVYFRSGRIDRAAIDEDQRTVELSFSSEKPYRQYFGTEILSHEKGAVDLSFIGGGTAPLLLGHYTGDQVGVVESAKIGADRKGRAVVRFSKSQSAQEVFDDVVDGIRANVSVGYHIEKMVLEEEDDEQGRTYRATKWKPLEISLVAIPADDSVGVGRQMRARYLEQCGDITVEPMTPKEGAKQMPEPIIDKAAPAAPPAPAVDVDKITADARANEQHRVREIAAIGQDAKMGEEAMAAIKEGASLEDFQRQVMAKMIERGKATPAKITDGDIGLTPREVQQFRICRMINAMANPSERSAWEAAAFEREACNAAAKKMQRQPRGFFLPSDLLHGQRDMVVGTPTAGGNLVATDLLAADFIDLLRAKLTLRAMGARVLDGLQGNVAIPKGTAGATVAWVAENAAPGSESSPTVGQLGLTPKTVSAYTDLSRRLIIQSSISVENYVRDMLAADIAVAVDTVGINGGGTNEPDGILATTGIGAVECDATNGAAPTWADVVALETEVAVDNADVGALGYLTNPNVRGKLKTTEKASGTAQFIWPDMPIEQQIVNGYRAMVTTAVPNDGTKGTGTALSSMIFGNFADLILGFWSVVDILVDPYTGSTAGTVRVVAHQDCDVGVRHPESFAAFTDAVTA